MKNTEVSKATLGRIPTYIDFLKKLSPDLKSISATTIAKELGLGEVQVRKDLGMLCGLGKPKIGYEIEKLIKSLSYFVENENGGTVIVGAGKLGRALLDYSGFADFGLTMLAAFDIEIKEEHTSPGGKLLLPIEALPQFCKDHNVKIGVITVPDSAAQDVCDLLCENKVYNMWCFAPKKLNCPANAVIKYENLALSLAYLKSQSTDQK